MPTYKKQTMDGVDFKGKTVLMRVDFNTPLDKTTRRMTDPSRIEETLPTIGELLAGGAKVVLMSHLGRPKERDTALSLYQAVDYLRRRGYDAMLAPDCVGEETEKVVREAKPGQVVVLENLRFHKEEEKNDKDFAASLASLGDVFVEDAFGTVHRAHASTVGVVRHFTGSTAMVGRLVEKELQQLGRLHDPERPYVVVLGGAKVSDKAEFLEGLVRNMSPEKVLIGGAMAFPFLRARGVSAGGSKVDEEDVPTAERVSKVLGDRLVLPGDLVAVEVAAKVQIPRVFELRGYDTLMLKSWAAYDIGPATVERFRTEIRPARSLLGNGPLGVVEDPRFESGSRGVYEVIAAYPHIFSASVGGDTAAMVRRFRLDGRMSVISTGGGASLMYAAGMDMPGIAGLPDAR